MLSTPSLAQVTLGPPEAVAANKVATDAWGTCVLQQAIRYSDLAENADTIGDASMTRCATFEPSYEATLHGMTIVDGPRLTDDTIKQIVLNSRSHFRALAVSTVLETRLNKAKKAN